MGNKNREKRRYYPKNKSIQILLNTQGKDRPEDVTSFEDKVYKYILYKYF